ncbi:MAG: hypothetical protein QM756_47255 [Polyangiaceae bacterium]
MDCVIEAAPSGRSKCRGCGRTIAKAELRFGDSMPNPYAEGDTLVWFHLSCAACMRPEQLLPVLSAVSPTPPDADWLRSAAEFGVAHRRLPRLARVERAASGRARCRSCRELMDKDRFRFPLQVFEDGRMNPIGSIHPECAEAYFGTTQILDRVARLTPDLDAGGLAELEAMMKTQRPAPPAEPDADESAPGLAKTSGDGDADGKKSADG